MAEKISKKLFYIIIIFLPLNLGYHFVLNQSYVNGLLVDYLVPVIYVQDIIVFFFLVLNLKLLISNIKKVDKYLAWFLFAVFLSTLSTDLFISSFTSFLRLFIYASFMFVVKLKYSTKDLFRKVVYILGWVVIFLSILAILQWFRQGSVFNNYLVLGEQPYTSATPGINIENFFGLAKVPPYATFRHPNIFAGLLSIVLIWFLFYMEKMEFLKFSYILGLIVLFLTLSKFSWISFALGIVFYLVRKFDKEITKYILGSLVFLAVIFFLLLPFVKVPSSVRNKPSYYRRAELLDSSYNLISQRPLFGVGYGTSTSYLGTYFPSSKDLKFIQPTHNIFVLLFLESGLFALLFFSIFLFKKLKNSFNNDLLYISILQVIFLGIFDHYFLTIHQTYLFLWLILGFV